MTDALSKSEEVYLEPMRLIDLESNKLLPVGEDKGAATISLSGVLTQIGVSIATWLGLNILGKIGESINSDNLIGKVADALLEVISDELRSELARYDLQIVERDFRVLVRLMKSYEVHGSSASDIQGIYARALEIYEGLRDHDLAGARLLAMTGSILVSVEQEIVLEKHGFDASRITSADKESVRANARSYASDIEKLVPGLEREIPKRFGGIRMIDDTNNEPAVPRVGSAGYIFDGKFQFVAPWSDANYNQALAMAESRMRSHERRLMRTFPEAISETAETLRSV